MYENLLTKEQNRRIEGSFSEKQIEDEKVSYFKYLNNKYNMKISDIVLNPKQLHPIFVSEMNRFTFKAKMNGMEKVEIEMKVGTNNSFVEFELRAFKFILQKLH